METARLAIIVLLLVSVKVRGAVRGGKTGDEGDGVPPSVDGQKSEGTKPPPVPQAKDDEHTRQGHDKQRGNGGNPASATVNGQRPAETKPAPAAQAKDDRNTRHEQDKRRGNGGNPAVKGGKTGDEGDGVPPSVDSQKSEGTKPPPAAQAKDDRHAKPGDDKQTKATPPAGKEIQPMDMTKIYTFGDPQKIWNKEFLKEGIKIRIVKKTWKAPGPAANTETAFEDFTFEQLPVSEAKAALEEANAYDHVEKTYYEAHNIFKDASLFNKENPSIFILPESSVHNELDFVTKTVTALGMRNLHKTHNIFVVDLSKLGLQTFMAVASLFQSQYPQFHPMASVIEDFIVAGINTGDLVEDKIHLIGWGYSGQLAGYVGRAILLTKNKKVKSILALNPMGGINNKKMHPVSKRDGEMVVIYHTNSFPVGTTVKLGTVDVLFNGGFVQPECHDEDDAYFCSHDSAPNRFWYIVLYGENLFEARSCDTLFRYNFGLCNNQPTIKLTYPLKEKPSFSMYYLHTDGEPPYGTGEVGSISDPFKKEIMEQVILDHREGSPTKNDFMVLVMDNID